MSIRLKLRRGTEAQNIAFIGSVGEMSVDNENWKLRVHDGSTKGGHLISDVPMNRIDVNASNVESIKIEPNNVYTVESGTDLTKFTIPYIKDDREIRIYVNGLLSDINVSDKYIFLGNYTFDSFTESSYYRIGIFDGVVSISEIIDERTVTGDFQLVGDVTVNDFICGFESRGFSVGYGSDWDNAEDKASQNVDGIGSFYGRWQGGNSGIDFSTSFKDYIKDSYITEYGVLRFDSDFEIYVWDASKNISDGYIKLSGNGRGGFLRGGPSWTKEDFNSGLSELFFYIPSLPEEGDPSYEYEQYMWNTYVDNSVTANLKFRLVLKNVELYKSAIDSGVFKELTKSANVNFNLSEYIDESLEPDTEATVATIDLHTASSNGRKYTIYSRFAFVDDELPEFGTYTGEVEIGDYIRCYIEDLSGSSQPPAFTNIWVCDGIVLDDQKCVIMIDSPTPTINITVKHPPMCCVPKGTPITINLSGETKPVEELKDGDIIVSYNTQTNKLFESKITKMLMPVRDHMIKITLKDGNELFTTNNHAVYTNEGWASWTPELSKAENTVELTTKQSVLNFNLSYDEIEKIEYIEGEVQLYNPQVESGNYFANNHCLHNGC